MKVEHEQQGDRKVYRVSAFNRGVASWLTRLPTIWVEGEVTEFRRQDRWQSIFFTLKDPGDGSCLPVSMPRSGFDALRLELVDGETVHVFGRPELFAARGEFRLRALTIEHLGLGAVLAGLERLKRRLAAEGLFSSARKRTLQIGAGVIGALVVIAVVVVVVGGDGGGGGDSVDPAKVAADAKAAGCTYSAFKSEGRSHTSGKVTYKTNPPTSGNHNPTPAADGIYRQGNSPPKENFVHTLEHGRIEFQYKPGASAADVAELRALAEEPLNDTAGYHTVLFENNTDMPAEFAATAWTKSITCPKLTPQALDAMRDFRKAFTDKGPEFLP